MSDIRSKLTEQNLRYKSAALWSSSNQTWLKSAFIRRGSAQGRALPT